MNGKGYLHWKIFSIKINKSIHWKISCIGKTTSVKKNVFIEKIASIEKLFSWKTTFIKKLLHIQNVTFKIFFGIGQKSMYENFSFPLKITMKMIMGYLNQNFDIKGFYIYKLFVY